MELKKLVLLTIILSVCLSGFAQFSLGVDFTQLRNISEQQKFWASGETVQVNYPLTGKESVYGWVNYYNNGRFSNVNYAKAKFTSTNPQLLPYTVTSWWRYHQFSIGWKHYFKGSYNSEDRVNIYGLAGFGLVTSKVHNVFEPRPKDSLYTIQGALEGDGVFRKLSFDLGLGAEWPFGGNFYGYADVRTWLPTSAYPSPYQQNINSKITPVIASVGLRMLFDFSY